MNKMGQEQLGVVSRGCIARTADRSDGAAVRVVPVGSLVFFYTKPQEPSEILFRIAQPNSDPGWLHGKKQDILQVPPSLQEGLLEMEASQRLMVATLPEGSKVHVLSRRLEPLCPGTIMLRTTVPGYKGVCFGIKLLAGPERLSDVINRANLFDIDTILAGVDVVVPFHQVQLANSTNFHRIDSWSSASVDATDSSILRMPRSSSHPLELDVTHNKNQPVKSRLQTHVRSFEHSNSTTSSRPVTRRQCASLDSGDMPAYHRSSPDLSHSEHLEDTHFVEDIPVTVLECMGRVDEEEKESFYDVPRSAMYRQQAEARQLHNFNSHATRIRPHVYTETSSVPNADLSIDSLVEVNVNGPPQYGVLRWLGRINSSSQSNPVIVAGVEMEEEDDRWTDGFFAGARRFSCASRRAQFVPLACLGRDSRFRQEPQVFGQVDCPAVEGVISPINRPLSGKNRGIQGHHNSCYLDASLFAMFAFTSVFDSVLYRPRNSLDIPQYEEVQRVLRDEIVNPLRRNFYVRADRVMRLRLLMERLGSVSGLTSEEKDPEEFLQSLLAQILKADPFLKLSSGQEAFHYQLFVEKDERLKFPTVQELFHQSFLTSNVKLQLVPSCLIIQMPRFGKTFKMYPRILPSPELDVTDVIENSPRQCVVCGKLAEMECAECLTNRADVPRLEGSSLCNSCVRRVHAHPSRVAHRPRALSVPQEFRELLPHCNAVPRLVMELFAVVCIETSHYVAFVNTGADGWVFFDSMADRKGEQDGYNIPEVVPCPELPYWLSEEGSRSLAEMDDERQLPEHAKRLLCDAYMCMYQSHDMAMYK